MFNEYKETYEKSIITKLDLVEKYLTDCACGVAKIYSYTLQYLNFNYKNAARIEIKGVFKASNNHSFYICLDFDIDEVLNRIKHNKEFGIMAIENCCFKNIFDNNRKNVLKEINRYEYKIQK